MVKSSVLSLTAAAAAGFLLRELWARSRARRERRKMKLLSLHEAEVSESLASGGSDGDAAVLCTRGVGRVFFVSRSDTALLLIDMQVDFLHAAAAARERTDDFATIVISRA